jgi:hypothetical protein
VFPVALSFLGASGLAFAAALMPYRPYFIGLTLISLGTAFYFTYRPQKDCGPDEACAVPRRRRFQVVFLMGRDRAGAHPPCFSLSGAVLATLGDTFSETATHYHSRDRSHRPGLARLLPLRR